MKKGRDKMGELDKPYIDDQKLREILETSMHGELKYTLMNDFLAKYSLQKDLYALKGLLAALLHLELNAIYQIEILNPIIPGEHIQDKDCILDIHPIAMFMVNLIAHWENTLTSGNNQFY